MKPCEHCKNLDDMESEVIEEDAPHHGSSIICDECEADYYLEWGGNILATNDQAKLNHPELKTI